LCGTPHPERLNQRKVVVLAQWVQTRMALHDRSNGASAAATRSGRWVAVERRGPGFRAGSSR
jgi:hypothetical protein